MTIKYFKMKKVILVLAISLGMGVFFTSCKETKKVENTEVHENHDHGADETATHEVYQCPMKCEGDKTYKEEGQCPVCHMDLKEVVKQ